MAFDPITAAFDLGGKLIERLIPDPTAKANAALELVKLQQSGELAQMTGQTDINKIEAASSSIFVSGWRPFIGWVCGMGLAYQFLFRPLAIGFCSVAHHVVDFPTLDMGTLITLLAGMLGFGAMRMNEKINGVASK